MTREHVDSVVIRSVGYDPTASVLEVEFVDSGEVYEYFDVPYSVYLELMGEESKGRYFNDFVKDLYASRRLGRRKGTEKKRDHP